MEVGSERYGENTIAYLRGEIDHHNARKARDILDNIIESQLPRNFYLDLSGVSFCDSSGLGLVMGRMKKCASCGSVMIVKDPSTAVVRILEIAGMEKIIKIERGNVNV